LQVITASVFSLPPGDFPAVVSPYSFQKKRSKNVGSSKGGGGYEMTNDEIRVTDEGFMIQEEAT